MAPHWSDQLVGSGATRPTGSDRGPSTAPARHERSGWRQARRVLHHHHSTRHMATLEQLPTHAELRLQRTADCMASDLRENLTDQLVTPERAEHWLDNWNTINRREKPAYQSRYAEDMKCGRWTRGSRIIFYKDGRLCDGQNRLRAVVATGIPVFFDILVGASLEEGANIDTGVKRTNADALKIAGAEPWVARKQTVSVVNWIVRWTLRSGTVRSFNHHRIRDFAMEHEAWLRPVIELQSSSNNKRGLSNAGFYSQVALALRSGENLGDLTDFVHRFLSGENYEKTKNAVIRLREYCLSDQSCWTGDRSYETGLRAQRAIKAFIDGQPLSKLYAPTEWIYEPPVIEL